MVNTLTAILPIIGKRKNMNKIITVFICLFVFNCRAQTIDTARLAAFYFNEAAIASKNQHVWNEELYGPMLFVDPPSRVTYANMPDSGGILKPEQGIYKGILPGDVIIANTSINWHGRVWSVIQWPLPTD